MLCFEYFIGNCLPNYCIINLLSCTHRTPPENTEKFSVSVAVNRCVSVVFSNKLETRHRHQTCISESGSSDVPVLRLPGLQQQ